MQVWSLDQEDLLEEDTTAHSSTAGHTWSNWALGFPGGTVVKNPPANAGDSGDRGWIPGWGRSPGVGILATYSSVLAWEIPWTEEPDGLQPMGSQSVGHNWALLGALYLSLRIVGKSKWDHICNAISTVAGYYHCAVLKRCGNSEWLNLRLMPLWRDLGWTGICATSVCHHVSWSDSGQHPSLYFTILRLLWTSGNEQISARLGK